MSRRGTAGVCRGLSEHVASSRDWSLAAVVIGCSCEKKLSSCIGYWDGHMALKMMMPWCVHLLFHSFLVTCLYSRRCRTCGPLLFLVSTPPWWLSKTSALHSPSKVLILFLLETLWIGSCSDPLGSLNGLVTEFIDIVCLHQDLQYLSTCHSGELKPPRSFWIKRETTHIRHIEI